MNDIFRHAVIDAIAWVLIGICFSALFAAALAVHSAGRFIRGQTTALFNRALHYRTAHRAAQHTDFETDLANLTKENQ